jgi:hypothetical protein
MSQSVPERSSLRIVSALAALVLAACGGSSSPEKPTAGGSGSTATTAAPTKAAVAPLEVHKAPRDQAIILGTDKNGGSTAVPLLEKETKRKVDVMWVRTGRPMTGGSSPAWLTARPQSDGQVKVGVFEQYEGGVGSQSRSSVWIASFLSATTLGRDLTDFAFSAQVGGFVDGPSAGGLYTAGYLAALTGAEVNPLATMTGTVNPDGTIGPVGGIPHKFEGSIKKGKKLLGYPVGLRNSLDGNTKKLVDLHALAEKGGAKAVEIRDIYDAYKLLTGKDLPRPVPLPVSEMDIEPAVAAAFSKRFAIWKDLRSKAWAQIISLARAKKLPLALTKIALVGAKEADAAEKAMREGLFVTAYARNVDATVYAVAATEMWRIIEKVQAGDIPGALALYQAKMNTVANTIKTMEKIGTMHPDTIGGHLLMISAFQKGTAAVGFAVWGMDDSNKAVRLLASLKGKSPEVLADPKTAEQVVQAISSSMLNFTRGEASAVAASQALEIESTQTINYSCSEPAARKLAKSYSSAASANLRYFESILLKQIGQATGLNEARARQYLGRIEPDYVTANTALRMALGHIPFIAKLKEKWGEESLAWSLQVLGGSILTYFKSSILISRWYSLGIQRDRYTGKATGIKHNKAFINMLENGERTAREHAHAAKIAVGSVPVQARIEYQKARVLREGDIDDKMKALEAFWASSSYSQTAVVMARQVINPKKHGAFGK